MVERSLQVPVGKHTGFRIDGKAQVGGGWMPIAITWVARYGMVFRFTAIAAPGALHLTIRKSVARKRRKNGASA